DYEPYGVEVQRSGVSGYTGSNEQRAKYTGKDRVPEASADYFHARWLGMGLGRFTTPDGPLVDQQVEDARSWNLYGYVRGNPLRYIDLDGRACRVRSDGSEYDDDEPGQSCAEVLEADKKRKPDLEVHGQQGSLEEMQSAAAQVPSASQNATDGLLTRLNSSQCRAIRIVLKREEQFGTPRAARMSGNTRGDGTLEPFNSTFVPNVRSPIGEIDLDWYTDLAGYSAGFAPVVYPVAKLAWTGMRLAAGVPIGNPVPLQDPGERTALFSVMGGQGYRDIFSAEFMMLACTGR
ncbi:MAG: RHS repeat-associated core domain-containing protein, partial [Bryobacter sp.]|nr:RHS repeat-associated core domain-containing protein [Bryobacter sp.]